MSSNNITLIGYERTEPWIPAWSLRTKRARRTNRPLWILSYMRSAIRRQCDSLRVWLGSSGGGMGPVEFLLRAGTDLVQFRVQSSDFRIQFDETQARRADQPVCLHSGIILSAFLLQTDTSGRQLSFRVALQIHKIETRSFYHAVIMTHTAMERRNKSLDPVVTFREHFVQSLKRTGTTRRRATLTLVRP